MSALLLGILNMSFAASWLIPVVLLLRLALRKAPHWIHVLLWAMVGLRLICPITVESNLSLVPSAAVVDSQIIYDQTPVIHTGVATVDQAVNPGFTQVFTPEVGASINPLQIWVAVGGLVWLAGFAAMLLYVVASYMRLWLRVRDSLPLEKGVYQCARVDSPFVLGLLRPKIYLPMGISSEDQSLVLAHERAHIRRKDHWWKPLGFFLLSVHWFNPLIWLAYILLCRDIEIACDEKVIDGLPRNRRADYSQALLSCSIRRNTITACPLAFGEVGVKTRVKRILSYKSPGFWILLIGIVVCVAVAVCFLTNPASQDDAPDSGRILAVGVQDYDGSVLSDEPQWFWYYIRNGKTIRLFGNAPIDLTFRAAGEDAVTLRFNTTLHQKDGPPLDELELEKGKMVDLYTATPGGSAKYSFLLTSRLNMEPGFVFDWLSDAVSVKTEQVIMFPYCPDVVFHYLGGQVWIDGPESERRELLSGMLIHNVYFSDLSGDGVPEVCATISFGSGIIDTYVEAADITTGEVFALRDRGVYDYALQVVENQLICTRTEYGTGRQLHRGTLTLVQAGGGNSRQLLLQQEEEKEKEEETHRIDGVTMTLEDVRRLAGKGEKLTMADLEGFACEDVGSGLHVLRYAVAEGYTLVVSTDSLSSVSPMLVFLYARNIETGLNILDLRPGELTDYLEADRQAAIENIISEAILAYNKKVYPDGLVYADSFHIFGQEVISGTPAAGSTEHVRQEVMYLHTMCTRYKVSGDTLGHVDSILTPAVAVFGIDTWGNYSLLEYWQPRTGTNRESDIRSRFPEGLVPAAMDCTPYLQQLEEACYQKAMQKVYDKGLLSSYLDSLFSAIAASPAHSSNPGDYIAAHPEEYRMVLSFGENTLRYCFEKFLQGGQHGLQSHLMALACEDIMASWDETYEIAELDRITGQHWFDALRQIAEKQTRLYKDTEIRNMHPGCWLLLQLLP